jgi:hypothetical protein
VRDVGKHPSLVLVWLVIVTMTSLAPALKRALSHFAR